MATREPIIDYDPELFREQFNRLPHEVQHTLGNNPLFELPALAELAQRIASRQNPHHPKGDIHIERGSIKSNSKFDTHGSEKIDVSELVKEIEKGQTWIILKHIEREDGYKEIFESCVCRLMQIAGVSLLKDIKWFEAILFITSPNRVTDYHIDRECSWLLQIQGNKEIHFFDRNDKAVLPDVELERYWTDNTFLPSYKPEHESRAIVYHMRPGTGVHSPVNTPHWLKNGNNVSVSLNINFQFHERAWENLFRVNHYIRRTGMVPSSPGKHPLADALKRSAYSFVQDTRRSLKGQPRVPATEARKHYHHIVNLLTDH